MTRLIATTFVCALAVCLGTASASATTTPDPTKACKKGWLLAWAPDQSADTDGNGFVCVDPTTGALRDDKGQFTQGTAGGAAAMDLNGDLFVCYNEQAGVLTDNDVGPASDTYPAGEPICPAGFVAYPVFLNPGGG
jgi:hypothetical protein